MIQFGARPSARSHGEIVRRDFGVVNSGRAEEQKRAIQPHWVCVYIPFGGSVRCECACCHSQYRFLAFCPWGHFGYRSSDRA